MVVRKFRQTTQHGAMVGKPQSKEVKFYNLDVIISVGYRVKSIQGTRFRQWATERLNEYIVKGFTMDDERLMNLGGGNYWKELLDHTRDCHEKINKKKENIFLFSTDTSLKFTKVFEYYQVRWTVVMYREWQTGLYKSVMLPGIYSGSVISPAKDIFSFTRMYFKDKTKSV